MLHRFRIGLLVLILLAGLLLTWGVVRAASSLRMTSDTLTVSALTSPTPLPDQPAAVSPDISSIDSPTASCILPQPNTGACYINWAYMYADASPNYMITMTVGIDDRARARYNGFFQNSMYVPSELMTFRVQCGALNSGGDPHYGAKHSYVLRARDSGGLGAANYGTVLCPADYVRIFLPMLRR